MKKFLLLFHYFVRIVSAEMQPRFSSNKNMVLYSFVARI